MSFPADQNDGRPVRAVLDEKTGEVIIEAVNVTKEVQAATIELESVAKTGKTMKVTTRASDGLANENSLREPKEIYPVRRVPIE